ncbi:unnamed protein product [Blepharisma stoltei]|uniref:Uncharacterized protein n=1 Tax=Blepharisma stoltei TaxID=1481888 RepID=A0AAU9J3T0_9CILI|nr:unnamed protein product [Blepharisma stoltei]
MLKLQIRRGEYSWSSRSVGCFIFLDNRLLNIITSFSADIKNSAKLPRAGSLRLTFKDMKDDKILGSVNILIELLPLNKAVWLPIFSSECDSLNELPLVVNDPKVLIFCETEEKQSIEINDNAFNKFSYEVEDIHAKCKEIEFANSEKIDSGKNFENDQPKRKYEERADNLMSQPDFFSKKYEELDSRCKIREASLLKLLEQKELEIKAASVENAKLQIYSKKLENENRDLSDKISKLEMNPKREQINILQNELIILKEQLANAEKSIKELTEEVNSFKKNKTSSSLVLSTEISALKPSNKSQEILSNKKSQECQKENIHSFPSLKAKILKLHIESNENKKDEIESHRDEVSIDSLVKEILSKTGYKGSCSKVSKNEYLFNGQKLYMQLKENRIYAKTGAILAPLEELLLSSRYSVIKRNWDSSTPKNNAYFSNPSSRAQSPREEFIRPVMINEWEIKTSRKSSPQNSFCISTVSSRHKIKTPNQSPFRHRDSLRNSNSVERTQPFRFL